ncbi:hypothetical protein FACS1894190_08350 [Spirochaetia bacterium]|nr:hypothetical protein FACS1894190_08350 [Spirochaetia bacterium]
MKRNRFFVQAARRAAGMLAKVLTFGLVLAGCASTGAPAVYDPTVPVEESCIIVIVQCAITKFDGVSTGLKMNALAGSKRIQIPAGQHTMQVYQKGGGIGYETENTVDGTFDFLPGYIYAVTLGTVNQGAKLTIVGTPRTTIDVSQELVPDPASPDASPFEGVWEYYNRGNKFALVFARNEFIWRFGEKDKLRGIFSIEDDKIILPLMYELKGKKWVERFGGILSIQYSGQELKFSGITLKKL